MKHLKKIDEELTKLYLESDVFLLADIPENIVEVSIKELDSNLLFCVSFPGCTWECGLNYIDIKLQTLDDKELHLPFENNIRGGISLVMGDRYVVSDENKKILYIDANSLYGYATMSQSLSYNEI